MNPPSDPNNPPNPSPSGPDAPPPLPPLQSTQPLPLSPGAGGIIDGLLKRPAALTEKLCGPDSSSAWIVLAVVALATFALYGLLVGSFSGGSQMFAAAVKISGGALFSALICLPSLYIFSCLSGADVSLRSLAGVIFGVLALTGLLLLGFAPVAWVFSQSTNSSAFVGALHLLFWFIGTLFGLRILRHMGHALRVTDGAHLNVWAFIFILVSLQMTTALRPLMGTADTMLPKEKKFFLAHWFDNTKSSETED